MLKRKYLCIFISGILFAAPFIFPDLNILSFFSAVPFLIILFDEIKSNKKNKSVKYAFVFGMSFYLPVYVWFLWMYPMEQTGVTPLQSAFIVTAAWLGFSFLQTLVMVILPAGLKFFRNIYVRKDNGENTSVFLIPVLTACLYVVAEWVQSWFLSGLTWAKLSISQYKNLFFIQSISFFGTYFTSFIIIFINSAIAVYILNKSYKTIPPYKNNLLILSIILLYFANSYFGLFRIYIINERVENLPEITVQIMQGNISSYEKWEDAGLETSMQVYGTLLEESSYGDADVCVFPETAIPASAGRDGRLYNHLRGLAEQNGITLFTGIIYRDEDKEYNAIMAFDKNYDFIQPYGKRHLVPFGEYLPLEEIITSVFPFVSNISLFDSVLTPGESPGVMNINGAGYGGLVCFDSIFPELARNSVKSGADVLIVVTNDSWFRDSTAIYQHNAQSVLRAVENNRYVIRAANTGISSFISPTGEILKQSDVLRREVLTEDIKIVKDNTAYTVFGDITLYLSCLYIIFCICLILKIKIKTKNNY